jgi:hypothetical protein
LQQSITTNTPFYGDNLAIMREYVTDESVRPSLPRTTRTRLSLPEDKKAGT